MKVLVCILKAPQAHELQVAGLYQLTGFSVVFAGADIIARSTIVKQLQVLFKVITKKTRKSEKIRFWCLPVRSRELTTVWECDDGRNARHTMIPVYPEPHQSHPFSHTLTHSLPYLPLIIGQVLHANLSCALEILSTLRVTVVRLLWDHVWLRG